MRITEFKTPEYTAFTIHPDKDEILSGVITAYTDAAGRFHVTVGRCKNKTEAKKVQKRNKKLIESFIKKVSL